MTQNKNFINFFSECNVTDINTFLFKIKKFKNFLLEENSTHNLTRIENDEEFWNKHISDSLSIAKYFSEVATEQLSVLDIGCGAGFPSFVLAAAFSNLKITAIDSVGKKISFLNKAVNLININNLEALHIRSKEFKTNKKFDIITARAVGEPFKIFKESKKLLNENGRYILYRTPDNFQNDLLSINKLTASAKFIWQNSEEFELPESNGKRLFFIGQKQ